MAYYDALIAKWATLSGTTAQKLAAINALTIAAPQPAIVEATAIVNAIAPTDFAALTQLQVSQLTLILSGGTVNGSPGTTTRLAFQTIFAGKATTLANLAALVAPFDSATIPWWQANGYGAAISSYDVGLAGLS